MAKKRLRRHKQYAMNRRRMSGKRPMCEETKEARKRTSAIDRERTKATLNKKVEK